MNCFVVALLLMYLSVAVQGGEMSETVPADTTKNTDHSVANYAMEWQAFVRQLLPLGETMLGALSSPHDEQLRAEMYKTIISEIASGYFGLLYADPAHPDLRPFLGSAFSTLGLNPDNVYYETPLDGSGTYKISGVKGTVHDVDFQIATGDFVRFGVGENLGKTLNNYDLYELKFNDDNSFDVLLSNKKPQGYAGNWWYLNPQASYMMIRQVAYDWQNEVDARIAIERLDTPAIKPRPSAHDIKARMNKIAQRAEGYIKASMSFVKKFEASGTINKLTVIDFNDDGGSTSQKYALGLYDLKPDEALIIETEIPTQCHYWSFQVADELFIAVDWFNRQSSLNGHMAHIDQDGKFRAVVSAQDPGVPNWLDNAGYTRGMVQGRWDRCSSWPTPTVSKVKLANIRQHLPNDTPIVSAEQRETTIRARRKAAQLRRRW